MPEVRRTGERTYHGIPVSAGVCRGKILVLGRHKPAIPQHTVSETDLPCELARLEEALVKTRHQILDVQSKVREAMGSDDASIFEAHLLVLEDRTLIDEVVRVIREDHFNVALAFHHVAEKYAKTLGSIADEYLRERAADMRDVTVRILGNLLNRSPDAGLSNLREPCIVLAHDLSPSAIATMDRSMVLGLATEIGSRTSHTAIMSRSLRLPAVVGLGSASHELETGESALLDGYNGNLIIQPTDQTLYEYGELARRRATLLERMADVQLKSAVTLDGRRLILSANVEQPEDTDAVKKAGAEGVGLFRTEYLFINRKTLPSEEEQYQAYQQVASALHPDPVVIRTLDLGGDKFLSHLDVPQELNPFLGWRAIRFCLEERDVFRTQLRAILRASNEGNVKLMFPMISCLKELEEAQAALDEYKAELRSEDVPFDEGMEVGIMIEIPSAAIIADTLAKRVKFFSIGTNDLIQYSLAVDRLNEKIAHLYEPTHPAIITLINLVAQAARRNKIWAGVCGEMAGDPELVPLLLGLGIDELSAAPSVVPQIKYLIRRLKLSDAESLAQFALSTESGTEILERSRSLAMDAAPALFEK